MMEPLTSLMAFRSNHSAPVTVRVELVMRNSAAFYKKKEVETRCHAAK